jgi:hypothetical protein
VPTLDTSHDAHRAQMRWYARLSPAEKVSLAERLSEDVREVARAGIRARHPEYGPAEVELALLQLLYGDELVGKAFASRRLTGR